MEEVEEPLTPDRRPPSAVHRHAIRFGMGAIKNVGEGAVQAVLDARAKAGPCSSLDDFCQRVDLRLVGKRALECLIKVGALDKFGKRGQMLEGLDQILNASASHFRAAEAGQLSLFGGLSGLAGVALPKPTSEVSQREVLGWEKELIGLYVSDHPLQPVMDDLTAVVTHYSQELTEAHDGQLVVMAGVVTGLRHHQTKKGDAMGFVSVEDLQGHLELVVFPKAWRDVSRWLKVEQIVVIRGKVDAKGSGTPKVLVDSLSREFKVTKSAEPQRPSAAPAPAPWADDGPPPWLDEELPLPEDNAPEAPPPPAPKPLPPSSPASGWSAGAPVAPRQGSERGGPPAAEAQVPTEPGGNGNGNGSNLASGTSRDTNVGNLVARPTRGGSAAWISDGASGGNGRSLPETAEGYAPPQPSRAPEDHGAQDLRPSEPRRVVVTIQATGDKERDVRRLRRIHGLLTSYPGADRFEFNIFEYNRRNYQLSFPNDTTGYCAALEHQLTDLLGPGTVQIQPL